jgi:O-acetyl-ADP-ribose deacetylase (regulator of RNase III)
VIRVVTQSLNQLAVQAVLRGADSRLTPLGHANASLDLAGGDRFTQELRVQAPLELGAAVVTGAGNLTAEFVIHLILQDVDQPTEPRTLRRALSSAWHRAEAWQLATVAAAPEGLGIPPAEAARMVLESFRERPAGTGYPEVLFLAVADPDLRSRLDQELSHGH